MNNSVSLFVPVFQLINNLPLLINFTPKQPHGVTAFYENPKYGCVNIMHETWNIFGASCNLPDYCGQQLKKEWLYGNFWSEYILCQRYNVPMVHPAWDIEFLLDYNIIFPGYSVFNYPVATDKFLQHELFLVDKEYWISNPFSNEAYDYTERHGTINKKDVMDCSSDSRSPYGDSPDKKNPNTARLFSYSKLPSRYTYWQKFSTFDVSLNKSHIIEKLNYPFDLNIDVYDYTPMEGYKADTIATMVPNCNISTALFTISNQYVTIYMSSDKLDVSATYDVLYVYCTPIWCQFRRIQKKWPYRHIFKNEFQRPAIFNISRNYSGTYFSDFPISNDTLTLVISSKLPRGGYRMVYNLFTVDSESNYASESIDMQMLNKDKICGVHDIVHNPKYGPTLILNYTSYYEKGKLYHFKDSFECNTNIPVIIETTVSSGLGIYQRWIFTAFKAVFDEVYIIFISLLETESWDIENFIQWLINLVYKVVTVLFNIIFRMLDNLGLISLLVFTILPLFTAFYIATQNYFQTVMLTVFTTLIIYIIKPLV